MIPGVGQWGTVRYPITGPATPENRGEAFPAILKSGFWHAEIEPEDIIRGED